MEKLAPAVIVISIVIGLTPFIVEDQFTTQTQNVFYSNVTVTGDQNRTGNLTLGITASDQLDFGKMPTTVEYVKEFNVNAPRKTLLTVSVNGNISQWMDYERKHYFNGTKKIQLGLNASETGYYDGNVTVKTMRAENKLGERWLYVKSGEFLP